MCCGGGGGPTETTVTNNALPEYAEPYYRDLLARTGYQTGLPYETYGGQRLAYFSPMETEAMARMGQLGVSGTPPELEAAGAAAYGLTGGWNPGINTYAFSDYQAGRPNYFGYSPDTRESGYIANAFDPTQDGYRYDYGQRNVGFVPGTMTDSNVMGQYMDPYFQNVVDVEKREAARQADMRHAQTGLEAAGMGSLGGYREALQRAETERNLMQYMGDIQTRGTQAAWQSGVQNFEADRQARAQLEQFMQGQFGLNEQAKQRASELMQQGWGMGEAARQAQEQMYQSQFQSNQQNILAGEQLEMAKWQAYEQARQQAAQMGLSAQQMEQAGQQAVANVLLGQNQNQLQAAGMLGDFAAQRQGMELERLNAMMQAGTQERNLMQQAYDIGYQDFLRQQGYPMELLNYYSMMLQGNTTAPGSTQQTYGPETSMSQQLLGGGIGLLGLGQVLGKGGSGGGTP